MSKMIVVCENESCGLIFEDKSGFNFSGSGNLVIHMTNSKVGPCPKCGSMGNIPDGIYKYKDYLLSFIDGPSESFEILSKTKIILEYHHKNSQNTTKQDIINEIETISPKVAEIVKRIPPTSHRLTWFAIAIAAVDMLINIQQAYFDKVEKVDNKKIEEMFIQTLLEENNEIKKKNIELDSLRRDALIKNKIRKYAIASKIGRNDPCPCNSGKKYKNCCGNPNKN
jgi:uncharacterized protein YchJ